eukprot:Platyproteum_vivax@DN6152_c0_g1_i1.p1
MQLAHENSLASIPLHVRSWEDSFQTRSQSETELSNLKETVKTQSRKLEQLDDSVFLANALGSHENSDPRHSEVSELSNKELDARLRVLESHCRSLKEQKQSLQATLAFTLTRLADGRVETQSILNDELPKETQLLEESKALRAIAETESDSLLALTQEEGARVDRLGDQEKELHEELDRILEDREMLTQKHKMLCKKLKTSMSSKGQTAKLLQLSGLVPSQDSLRSNDPMIIQKNGAFLAKEAENLEKIEAYSETKALAMQALNMHGIKVEIKGNNRRKEKSFVVELSSFEDTPHRSSYLVIFGPNNVPYINSVEVSRGEELDEAVPLAKVDKWLQKEPIENRTFPDCLPDLVQLVIDEMRWVNTSKKFH